MATHTEGAGYSAAELEEHITRVVQEGDEALWKAGVNPYSQESGMLIAALDVLMRLGLSRENARGALDRIYDLRPLMLTYVEVQGTEKAKALFDRLRQSFQQKHRI